MFKFIKNLSPFIKYSFGFVAFLASLTAIFTYLEIKPSYFNTNNKIEYKGEWDRKKVNSIIKERLIKDFPNTKVEFCDDGLCTHSFDNEYSLTFPNKEITLVELIISNKGACRACGVSVSLFEFKKITNGWVLDNIDYNVYEGGTWGGLHANPSVKVIGDNYGYFIMETSPELGGVLRKSLSIHAKLKDDYKQVLNIPFGFSSPEHGEWDSSIKIIRGGTIGFFDIVINSLGNYENIKIAGNTTFEFNGFEYKAEKLPWYFTDCDFESYKLGICL